MASGDVVLQGQMSLVTDTVLREGTGSGVEARQTVVLDRKTHDSSANEYELRTVTVYATAKAPTSGQSVTYDSAFDGAKLYRVTITEV